MVKVISLLQGYADREDLLAAGRRTTFGAEARERGAKRRRDRCLLRRVRQLAGVSHRHQRSIASRRALSLRGRSRIGNGKSKKCQPTKSTQVPPRGEQRQVSLR